jgi:hypothetical protein
MEKQEQPQAEATATPIPELTVTDLQNIRAIIDAASRRGAFGASEMSAIGATFNKLDTFLNAVAAPESAPNEES